MSRGRYLAGLISGIIGAVAVLIWTLTAEFSDFFVCLLMAYVTFSLLSQLVWWRGYSVQLFLIIAGVGLWVLRLAWNFFISGNVVLFILSLFMLGPCLSFFAGAVGVAVIVACVVAMVTTPFLLFRIPKETY